MTRLSQATLLEKDTSRFLPLIFPFYPCRSVASLAFPHTIPLFSVFFLVGFGPFTPLVLHGTVRNGFAPMLEIHSIFLSRVRVVWGCFSRG